MSLKPFVKFTNNYEDKVIAFGGQVVIAYGWKVINLFFLWCDFTIGFKEESE